LIIGGNGCGKTTFAQKLSDRLNLPLVHLDTLYWTDGWKPVADEIFDEQLLCELIKPVWMIEGNIARTIPLRLQYCDTVIYMDFPRIRCLWGVIQRVLKNYGESRFDMGGYCPEKLDMQKLKFFLSVWASHKKKRRHFYAMLDSVNCQVIILKNRRQTRQFLQNL
jgi:adenylate kinase family enzyme